MSRLFGPIRQNGYVVRDLEAAMRHWAEVLHVGPFFHLPHVDAMQGAARTWDGRDPVRGV